MSEQKLSPQIAPEGREDRYERRRRRRERWAAARSARLDVGGWVSGLLLVALGLLFLAQNAGYFTEFANWWALFLLLPAAAFLSAAFATYRRHGDSWTGEAIAPLLGSGLFVALAAAFLLELDLSLLGPILLIAGGLLLLLGARR